MEVRSEWPIYDGMARKMSTLSPILMKNNLLLALHPRTAFFVCQVNKKLGEPKHLHDFQERVGDERRIFKLDLASGSRSHGQFTFAHQTVGQHYFFKKPEDEWKRIIYGSIMHTGCKKMVFLPIKFIITDDRLKVDDPTNNYHWYTGDSHAKGSAKLIQALGLPLSNEDEINPLTPVQFRVAEFGKWIGKGTISWNRDLDNSGYDLAVPLSSLKGNKLELGNYEAKLLFGTVFEAEKRQAKLGWMLFQWFSFEALEKDGIISKMRQKCQDLANAYNSIELIAEYLKIDKSEDLSISDNETESEYEDKIIEIIKADTKGLLLLHPYVVDRIRRLLQKTWLNLAKSAGVKFYSVMCQPDETLRHYFEVVDGRIVGRKVMCCASLEEGEYIVFCNPMRHWGDVQLWENIHEGAYIESPGVLAGPTELLLSLGRDFDGDFVQLIKSSRYPNMRDAIANFTQAPATVKFPKVALKGDIKEIAIRSMNDSTGIVASLLGRARSAGVENVVLLIPPGGEQSQAQEMRIIDFLGQQLQIAVDSLKSAYPNNDNGLKAVQKYLDSLGVNIPWLKDFKNPECYRDRKCDVAEEAVDTISRLVKEVNSYWKAENFGVNIRPNAFIDVLFTDTKFENFEGAGKEYDEEWARLAYKDRDQYRLDMKEAIEWKDEHDGDLSRVLERVTYYSDLAQKYIDDLIIAFDFTGIKNKDEEIARCLAGIYWRVANDASSGGAGMVFTMFYEEILKELKRTEEKPPAKLVEIYGTQYYSWAASQLRPWIGQVVSIRFLYAPRGRKGENVLCADMLYPDATKQFGWHALGLVKLEHRPLITVGETRQFYIYSIRFKGGKTSSIALFDLNTDEQQRKAMVDSILK
ncbi:MAG TPA: hypothetical protein DDW51_05605 [Cyanobacteria bacterium UBA11367]|nr:hypothetical protein [Cyanobacteria bacterium UBA11367]HBE56759.1 hypothetical protein [Cyanobacteria bacterium UBA11366]